MIGFMELLWALLAMVLTIILLGGLFMLTFGAWAIGITEIWQWMIGA